MNQIKSQMFIAKNLYQMSQLVVAGDVIPHLSRETSPLPFMCTSRLIVQQ